MARIFEALWKTSCTTTSIPGETAMPVSAPLVLPADTEEIPFVEVGGDEFEASTAVLSESQAKHQARSVETTNRTVMFRPLPGALGPADPGGEIAASLVALHSPDHPLAAQYQQLLVDICQAAGVDNEDGAAKVLLFSGIQAEVGTTTAVLNLAATSAAVDRKRVVVVDAAACRPAVAQNLQLSGVPGLREVLTGAVPLSRALQRTRQPNLWVLTAGQSLRSCLAVKSLPATLQQLGKRFDLVFVDATTWHGGPEMSALASACDALFLVVPKAAADLAETLELLHTIRSTGIALKGSVVIDTAA
ncbi:MAG: hypothetical protein KatS3mg105_3732 [Gemmatales bacterium]|nr:MAG: hypothetical protein KatS3mg105_3732 [Gemmatales bacterium]